MDIESFLAGVIGSGLTIMASGYIENAKLSVVENRAKKAIKIELEDISSDIFNDIKTLHDTYCRYWLYHNSDCTNFILNDAIIPRKLYSEALDEQIIKHLNLFNVEQRKGLRAIIHLIRTSQGHYDVLYNMLREDVEKIDLSRIYSCLSCYCSLFFVTNNLIHQDERFKHNIDDINYVEEILGSMKRSVKRDDILTREYNRLTKQSTRC